MLAHRFPEVAKDYGLVQPASLSLQEFFGRYGGEARSEQASERVPWLRGVAAHCSACGRQTSLRSGTVTENNKLSSRIRLLAICWATARPGSGLRGRRSVWQRRCPVGCSPPPEPGPGRSRPTQRPVLVTRKQPLTQRRASPNLRARILRSSNPQVRVRCLVTYWYR